MKYLKKIGCFMALVTALFLWSDAGEAKDIVIGFSGPLSGPAAEYGRDCVNGLDMAVKQVNKTGGIKIKGETYTLRLEKLDDQIDPTRAVNNARRFREQHGAVAIFQPVGALGHAMMSINREKNHEFIMMAYDSTPATPKLGNELTVILPPPLTIYAQVFTKWCADQGYSRAGIVVNGDAYGAAWTEAFTKYFKGTITAVKPANFYAQTDFSANITAVLATKPDVILCGGPSPTTALFIEQTRSMGYKGAFVLIDQAKLDYVRHILKGVTLLENVIAVSMVDALPGRITPWILKNMKDNYKGTYTWEVSIHYGAVTALARAIAAAGTATDIRAIRKAFAKAYPLADDKTPSPVFGLTNTGIQLMPASVQSIKDGKVSKPRLPIWWVKTQKEFEAVKKALPLDPNLVDWEFLPLEF